MTGSPRFPDDLVVLSQKADLLDDMERFADALNSARTGPSGISGSVQASDALAIRTIALHTRTPGQSGAALRVVLATDSGCRTQFILHPPKRPMDIPNSVALDPCLAAESWRCIDPIGTRMQSFSIETRARVNTP